MGLTLLIGAVAGVFVSLAVAAARMRARRALRRRGGWPRHDARARPSAMMAEPVVLEVTTAFAAVMMARPSIVADLLGIERSTFDRAVQRLRDRGYLEVGRFDGTETTLALSEAGRRAYAQHRRAIAPRAGSRR